MTYWSSQTFECIAIINQITTICVLQFSAVLFEASVVASTNVYLLHNIIDYNYGNREVVLNSFAYTGLFMDLLLMSKLLSLYLF